MLEKADFSMSSEPTFSLSGASGFFTRSLAELNLNDTELHIDLPIGSLFRSLRVTCGLLRLLTSTISHNARASCMAARHVVSHSLDLFRRLWLLIIRHFGYFQKPGELSSELVLEFFEGLQQLSASITAATPGLSFTQKFSLLWAACVADYLKAQEEADEATDQSAFQWIVDATIRLAGQVPSLIGSIRELLGPILDPRDENGHLLMPREQNANVRKVQALKPSAPHLNAIFQELSNSFLPLLESYRIRLSNQDAQDAQDDHALRISDQGAPIEDSWPEGRARKRLRLSSDEQVAHPISQVERLHRKLNKILIAQETSDLDGLSKVAS